jgi:hypothetical protein
MRIEFRIAAGPSRAVAVVVGLVGGAIGGTSALTRRASLTSGTGVAS